MKNPVYIIFGVEGLIGKCLYEKLLETMPDYRIYSFDHAFADISNKQHVREIMDFVGPTVVINCAGVSSPDICEQAPAGAFEVNAVGPKVLAEQCDRIGAKLVHFSSCSVFGGNRFHPYSERAKTSPLNVYGRSKASGEMEVQKALKDHLIIRPGWLFHHEPPNFMAEWVAQIDRKLIIPVFPNTHGSPTFLPDMIDVTLDLLARDARGIFHVANSEATTWDGLASMVLGLTHGGSQVRAISDRERKDMPPTPPYNVLSTRKLKSLTRVEMRPWASAVKQCLFQMQRYSP